MILLLVFQSSHHFSFHFTMCEKFKTKGYDRAMNVSLVSVRKLIITSLSLNTAFATLRSFTTTVLILSQNVELNN